MNKLEPKNQMESIFFQMEQEVGSLKQMAILNDERGFKDRLEKIRLAVLFWEKTFKPHHQ